MHIVIALDDCIRNISSIKLELPDITHKEWLDHKSLAVPHLKAEDKINKWYDQGYHIHIITQKNQDDIKWLDDHYIPYDSIIDKLVPIKPDYWLDSSIYRCFNACSQVSNILLINENLKENDIEKKCGSLHLPYPIPNKINITTWTKVFIND